MLMIDANFYHGCYALRKRNTYLTALKSAAAVLILETRKWDDGIANSFARGMPDIQ